MTGKLVVVGTGPGNPGQTTPETLAAITAAEMFFGYGPYLDRIPARAGQSKHASDNRVEIDRARHALELAAAGKKVAVVSGGDPGVFAMAAAVCEAIDKGPEAWREIEIVVTPGVTAMLAVAARSGAPASRTAWPPPRRRSPRPLPTHSSRGGASWWRRSTGWIPRTGT